MGKPLFMGIGQAVFANRCTWAIISGSALATENREKFSAFFPFGLQRE